MGEQVSVRLSRVLAVLAVLAGVIAMHGLETAHHGVTATPLVPAVLAAMDADGHAHAAATAQTLSVDDHACDALCQGSEQALALLCVAVLLAAAAGVLGVLRRRTGLLPRKTGPPTSLFSRTAAPPRSFDLVAQLCISRT
jgi:hypothetical protein